jgi:large repetitive protein
MRKYLRFFAILLVAVAVIGCQKTTDDNTKKTITVDVTGIALTAAGTTIGLTPGATQTLAYTMTPTDANTGLTWASSDANIATVSDVGLVTAIANGTVTITVSSTKDPNISSNCTVYIATTQVDTNGWKLSNLADPIADGSSTAVPTFIDGKATLINNSTGGFASAGITNSTFLYFDQTLTGDFVIRARVRLTTSTLSSSASTGLGIGVGAFAAPTSGVFAGSTQMVMMMCRAAVGGNKLSYYTKAGGNGTGNPTEAGSVTPYNIERVFEVKRLAASGYALSIYKADGTTLVGTNTVGWYNASAAAPAEELSSTMTATTPVVAGFALTGWTAEIANVHLATLDASSVETPLFDSSTVAASPVSATKVTIAGPTGYAASYSNSFANAQSAGGVQLSATVLPAEASNTAVTWSSDKESVATVSATGLVTAVAIGTATITATTVDGGFTSTYAIEFTDGSIKVASITLSGSSTLYLGTYSPLTATIAGVGGATPTDPSLTWTSSADSVATVSSTGKVTSVAAGNATITAAANDGSGVKGIFDVTVSAAPSVLWSWTAGTDAAFDLTSATATVNGLTLVKGGGTVTGGTEISLANSRFNVGSASTNSDLTASITGSIFKATTGTVNVADGQLNFTQKATVSVTYSSLVGTGFSVYVNNNGTGETASVLYRAASGTTVTKITPKLSPATALAATAATTTSVYTIDPTTYFVVNTDSLATAFLQFRADSSTTIKITSIVVAYAP